MSASGPDCRANAPERPNAAIGYASCESRPAPAVPAAAPAVPVAAAVAAAPAAVHAPVAQTVPAAVATATLVSLSKAREEHWRREKLAALIQHFRVGAQQLGFSLMESATPIQPLLIGADQQALTLSQQLREKGFLVTAIRPPTVPEGQARLRVTLSASHQETDVEALLVALEEVGR